MRKVIVNSTPLIILCGIGKLNILKEVYEEIIIPSAVYTEVTAKADSACIQLQSAGDWIRVEQIKDHSEKKMYKAKLHNGEVRTIRYWNIRCFSESKTARDHKRSTSAFVGNETERFLCQQCS